MKIKGQHIAVLGAGESGSAAARLLLAEGARVTVLDSGSADSLRGKIAALQEDGANVIAAAAADADTGDYEFAVLSPGIDPASVLVKNFIARAEHRP